MINVLVQLQETSQPIKYENVLYTYQKGDFFVIEIGNKCHKYPISRIWRIIEDYGYHSMQTKLKEEENATKRSNT